MKTKRLFSRVLAALVLMLPGWVVAQSVVSLNDYTPAWNVGGFNSIEATATAAGNVLVGDTATIAVANFGTTEHPVDFGDTAYVAPTIKVTPMARLS